MKNKYVVPCTQMRNIKMKTFVLSTSDKTNGNEMNLNKDNLITDSDEILTKERTFYEDDGLLEW